MQWRFSFTHLQSTEQVVLAADLTHLGEDNALEPFAKEVVVQFTSQTGFEVASLMQALGTLRVESGELLVEEVVSQQYSGYEVSLPSGGDRFYTCCRVQTRKYFLSACVLSLCWQQWDATFRVTW